MASKIEKAARAGASGAGIGRARSNLKLKKERCILSQMYGTDVKTEDNPKRIMSRKEAISICDEIQSHGKSSKVKAASKKGMIGAGGK